MAKVIDAESQAIAPARVAISNFRYVIVGLMFIGATLLWADRLNISIAAPQIVKAYGWSPAVLGGVFSAFTFGYLITQIPGGRWGDAAPRRVLGYTALLWSLFTALTPFGRTPAVMMGIRSLLGLSEGPFLVTIVAMVTRWVPRGQRASVNGFITGPANWAPVLFLPFAAWLVRSYGWPSTFYVFAALGFVWAAAWLAVAREWPEQHRAVGKAELDRILDGRGISSTRLPIGPVLKHAASWGTILGWVGIPYANYMMLSWLPTLLVSRFHMELLKAGLYSALPFLCCIVGQLVGGIALDYMTRGGVARQNGYRTVIGVGMLGAAICFYTATVNFHFGWVETFISAGMGLMGLAQPMFYTLPIDISATRAGTLAGIMNFAGICGAVVSPFLTGWIVQTTGQWYLAFYAAVGLLIVTCATAIALVRGPLAVPDVSPN